MGHLLKTKDVLELFSISRYYLEKTVEKGDLEEIILGEKWKYYKIQDCIRCFGNPGMIKEIETMGKISSTYYLSKFAAIISKPFSEWNQYKQGVIDAKGNRIVSKDKFNTAFKDPIYRVARKVKMLLQNKFHVPDNKVLWTAISLYLLKEDTIGQVLDSGHSQKALKELQELQADFDFEEKLVLQKLINISGLVAQKSVKESFKEFIGEPEEDKPKYWNTFQILSGHKFWKRLEEEEARANHGK